MYSINLTRRSLLLWSIALVLFILLAVFVSLTSAIVVCLLIAAFLIDLDPVVPLAISLSLLGLCPLMILIEQASAASSLANWAYWFLSIGVLIMLYRHVRYERGQQDSPDE
jgi:ABC-type multidrug transport system permease subunit